MMSKSLVRVFYRSISTLHPDNTEELDRIFKVSTINNRRDNLTGCLAHPDGHFVQVIEGDGLKVDRLLQRISIDTRHTDMSILGRWASPSRLFTGWAMARPNLAPLHQQSLKIINQVGCGSQVTAILLSLAEQSGAFYAIL